MRWTHILTLLTLTLTAGCWLGHDYSTCATDTDCYDTHRCVESLCQVRPGYTTCDPAAPDICPSGLACSPQSGVCLPDQATGDAGQDLAADQTNPTDTDAGTADATQDTTTEGDTSTSDTAVITDDAGEDDADTSISDSSIEEDSSADVADDVSADAPVDTSPDAGDMLADTSAADAAEDLGDPDHPAPTAVLASDGTFDGFVNVSWNAALGATGYTVYRDGTPIASEIAGTTHDDAGATRNPPSATGFDLVATTTLTDRVTLIWNEPETAWPHEYWVVAHYDDGDSGRSASDFGYRGVPAVTRYELQIDGGDWNSVGLVLTHDDTDAPAPVLSAGSAIASDGTTFEGIQLDLSAVSSTAGSSVSYRIRSVSSLGDGTATSAVMGNRAALSTEVQWQRSTTGVGADYADVPAATSGSFLDVDAPVDGSVRYYRARVGIGSDVSLSDDGTRRVELLDIGGFLSADLSLPWLVLSGNVQDTTQDLYRLEDPFSWVDAGTVTHSKTPIFTDINGDLVVTMLLVVFGDDRFFDVARYQPGTSEWSVEYESAVVTEDPASYGNAVGISGDWAIIGHPSAEAAPGGAAWLYHYDAITEDWLLDSNLFESPQMGDGYGSSIAMAEDVAVVGARFRGTGGEAQFLRRSGLTWSGTFMDGKTTAADDRFGESVATDGTRIVVGAPYDGASVGTAFVFAYVDGSWVEEQELTALGLDAGDRFGSQVSISGNQIVVGANGSSRAYLYRYTGESWEEDQSLYWPTPYGLADVEVDGNWIMLAYAGDIALLYSPF